MSKVDTVDLEMWVKVDEVGNYVVVTDEDTLNERWADEVGADEAAVSRVIKLKVSVPRPKAVEVELAVELPEETAAGVQVA